MTPIRKPFNSVAVKTRRMCGWLLCGLFVWVLWGWAATAPGAFVKVLSVQDAIGPASADYVVRGIQKAQAESAALVVLELNTPGGLDTAMRQIIQAILASPVPVVTYVSPQGARAASAGTYILYASHVAAMAPATTLGAATPVAVGLPATPRPGSPRSAPASEPEEAGRPGAPAREDARNAPEAPSNPMAAKQVHDASAFIRGLAQLHGRNADWAERAVREAVSLTADEALAQGVVDVVALDLADLLKQIDGREVRLSEGVITLNTRGLSVLVQPPDWRSRLLSVIANPSFALILLMVGIYGLIFEFGSPGFGLPGTVGAICLLLAMFALQMLPVNYAALGLILLGFALLAAELLTPAFGVLGVGGVIALSAGGLLLFDSDVPGMGVPLPLVFGVSLAAAVGVLAGGSMALRARRARVVSGREEMVGATGQITAAVDGKGWALLHGERWQVRATVPLAAGQLVRVTGMTDLILQVEPIQDDPGRPDVSN